MVCYIDAHCHLEFSQLYSKIDTIIKNAESNGVKIILTNGVDKNANRIALELSEKYKLIKPALGFYPPDIESNNFSYEDFKKEIDFIKKNKQKILAMGEIGMDYKHVKDKALQKDIFISMLRLAKQLNKPIIVHSRQAEEDTIKTLENEKMKKVVLHCFNGKSSLIEKALSLGYSFSIPTNIVRSTQMQDLVALVPMNKIFAETDSPFLSPFKEKMNEPSFVVESYKKIAEIKQLNLEEVKNNIWLNYQRIFN